MAFFRLDNTISTVVGQALDGIDVYVCSQPATTDVIPPSPLIDLYSEPNSNTVNVTAASWELGVLELTLASIPADVIVGSYLRLINSNPNTFNGIYQVQDIDGLVVTVALATDPGTYIGSGQVQTSALPNPIQSDGLGNWFFYAASGTYTIVYNDPLNQIPTQIFPDQQVISPGGGSVESVALVMPADFSVAGSPGTDTVDLVVTEVNQNANAVKAGPVSGGPGAPTYRPLVVADLPAGAGTVSSVGLTVELPSWLQAVITGSPVVAAGTIDAAITAPAQAKNTVLAGPTTGSPASPGFRVLVAADVPAGLVINWRGQWNSGATYLPNDAVYDPTHESSYICITGNTNSEPPNGNWNILAGPGSVALAGDLGGGSPGSPDVIGLLGTGVIPFTLYFFINGVGSNAQKLFRNKIENGITVKFPASAPNSEALAGTAATGSTTYTFSKNGTPFATLAWSASGTVGGWTQASDATLIGGTDRLDVTGPATADATLADIGITFAGVRTA